MPLTKLRKTAVKKLTEFATSERVMGLLGDPRVQKTLLGVLKLQAQARSRFEKGVSTVAGGLSLATQKDVSALKKRIRDLERQLEKLRDGGKPKAVTADGK